MTPRSPFTEGIITLVSLLATLAMVGAGLLVGLAIVVRAWRTIFG